MERHIKIGDVLIECGYITESQVTQAIEVQKNNKTKRLGELMINLGFITEKQLLFALSKKLNVPYIDFKSTPVDLKTVGLIPKTISLKYCIIAISNTNGQVTLAVNDPLDFYAIEDVKSFINGQCDIVVAEKDGILEASQKYYAEIEAQSAVSKANKQISDIQVDVVEDIALDDSVEPIIHLINSILLKGYADGASDIHFEPFEEKMSVRLRIDGQLVDYTQLDIKTVQYIITRIKILGTLDIAEKRVPQDGAFKIKIGGQDVGVRVATIPTVFGEKVVLRFLTKSGRLDYADQYGMNETNYRKVARMLRNPHGIIYVTGPTGSGKTTTLYMMLEDMAKLPFNISTIEDPVERNIPKVNQVQVNTQAGMTFESGLRAMLRQDPDVILVGETRDRETANTAVTAALTGHLVLSTLHTNDAISSIVRLMDMGVESYLLANSLVGIVAQRLVKKVCPYCKETYTPTEEERAFLREGVVYYRGRGCHNCNDSGYKGRMAVHEVLEIDASIRKMITDRRPIEEVYTYVRDKEMQFIKHQVLQLVEEGITTVDEYMRHTAFTI